MSRGGCGIRPGFDGMHSIDGMLDPEAAATLQAALTPLTGKAGETDSRTVAQRTADALTELATFSLAHGELPDHGGERPQVVVTIDWNQLHDQAADRAGSATLNGAPISSETARRIACDAQIIPALLAGTSEILDLGRATKTWNRAQRRAARLRDSHCTWPGCTTSLDRCQLHHLHHWAHGGPTNHANSTHLCGFHHWLTHHRNWTITRNPTGHIQIRRT
jgi:hypothetical protein